MELICTALKAAVICVASFDLGPLEHGIASMPGKVCFHRQVVASESPRGVVVQGHGCGTVGIYNPTLKANEGTVTVWFQRLPSLPSAK